MHQAAQGDLEACHPLGQLLFAFQALTWQDVQDRDTAL